MSFQLQFIVDLTISDKQCYMLIFSKYFEKFGSVNSVFRGISLSVNNAPPSPLPLPHNLILPKFGLKIPV